MSEENETYWERQSKFLNELAKEERPKEHADFNNRIEELEKQLLREQKINDSLSNTNCKLLNVSIEAMTNSLYRCDCQSELISKLESDLQLLKTALERIATNPCYEMKESFAGKTAREALQKT